MSDSKDTTRYKDLQVDRRFYAVHGVLGGPAKGLSNILPETFKGMPVICERPGLRWKNDRVAWYGNTLGNNDRGRK